MIATLLTGQQGALSVKQHYQSAGHAMPCVLCLSCSTASPQAMYALPCVLCLSCSTASPQAMPRPACSKHDIVQHS
jgi:hypothetical protein